MGKFFASADKKLYKVEERVYYCGKKGDLDTVVFVHGLGGNHQKTWKKFPALLKSDPDLPNIDVLLWGYKTGAISAFVQGTKTLGRHLVTTLTAQVSPHSALHLVGHSMGGLIILQGLVQEMAAARAQKHPTQLVTFISLYASPVSGSRKCAFAKNTVGKLWGLKIIVNEQIRSLASGEDCDAFIEQVRTHIHEPVADSKSARTIPIRMLMATNDKMVDFDDTHTPSALYARVAAQQLDATHSDIKLPDSHLNTRYRVLTMDIQNGLAERFQQICQAYLTGDAEEKKECKNRLFQTL